MQGEHFKSNACFIVRPHSSSRRSALRLLSGCVERRRVLAFLVIFNGNKDFGAMRHQGRARIQLQEIRHSQQLITNLGVSGPDDIG
jgi:hypothetical protein